MFFWPFGFPFNQLEKGTEPERTNLILNLVLPRWNRIPCGLTGQPVSDALGQDDETFKQAGVHANLSKPLSRTVVKWAPSFPVRCQASVQISFAGSHKLWTPIPSEKPLDRRSAGVFFQRLLILRSSRPDRP